MLSLVLDIVFKRQGENMKFNDNIEELLESLSLDELIGQMICYDSVFSRAPSVQKAFVKGNFGRNTV